MLPLPAAPDPAAEPEPAAAPPLPAATACAGLPAVALVGVAEAPAELITLAGFAVPDGVDALLPAAGPLDAPPVVELLDRGAVLGEEELERGVLPGTVAAVSACAAAMSRPSATLGDLSPQAHAIHEYTINIRVGRL